MKSRSIIENQTAFITWCVDFSEVPAGVNHDDELVPQGGVAYSQVDLPKWTLMFPDGSTVMRMLLMSKLVLNPIQFVAAG